MEKIPRNPNAVNQTSTIPRNPNAVNQTNNITNSSVIWVTDSKCVSESEHLNPEHKQ